MHKVYTKNLKSVYKETTNQEQNNSFIHHKKRLNKHQ